MSIALTSASRALRCDSRGISRSIDRDFEERRRLRRDSSVVRRSSFSSFFGIVGLVRPRHDVAGATSTTGEFLFFHCAPPPRVSSSFFAGVHRFSSRAPGRPLEQLTTGQPWPTDCPRNPVFTTNLMPVILLVDEGVREEVLKRSVCVKNVDFDNKYWCFIPLAKLLCYGRSISVDSYI